MKKNKKNNKFTKKTKATRSEYVRRSGDELEDIKQRIRACIKEAKDISAPDIAKALKESPEAIRGPLKALVAEGRVLTQGARRWMTYQPRKKSKEEKEAKKSKKSKKED